MVGSLLCCTYPLRGIEGATISRNKDIGNQIQFLVFVQSIYIIWYGQARPHRFRSQAYLEIFNESMLMMLYYHVIIFSDFVIDPMARFQMGYSFLTFFGIIIIVNLAVSSAKSFTIAKLNF